MGHVNKTTEFNLRTTLILLIFIVYQGARIEHSRTVELLCREWREVGFRNLDGPYEDIQTDRGDTLQFDLSGAYTRKFYGVVAKGSWRFGEDSTRLSLAIRSLGRHMLRNAIPLDRVKPTTMILILTQDSLVLRTDLDENKGRVDKYYVPIRK